MWQTVVICMTTWHWYGDEFPPQMIGLIHFPNEAAIISLSIRVTLQTDVGQRRLSVQYWLKGDEAAVKASAWRQSERAGSSLRMNVTLTCGWKYVPIISGFTALTEFISCMKTGGSETTSLSPVIRLVWKHISMNPRATCWPLTFVKLRSSRGTSAV